MIQKGWLLHNEILIMDNATVHTVKESSIVKDFLWYTVIDGRPLKILVIYLSPPCPELNQIKKNHVLSKQVQAFCHDKSAKASVVVLKTATNVMNNFSYELTKKQSIAVIIFFQYIFVNTIFILKFYTLSILLYAIHK